MGQQTCPVCERQFYHHHGHARVCCSEACRRLRDEAKHVIKRTMSATEAAYVAGLVDGEGTVSIWRERRKANVSGYGYVVAFSISQASLEFLEIVREMVGNGVVRLADARKKNPQHKRCYSLDFNRSQTRWVLPQVLPYLLRKRRQAEVVFRCLATLNELSRRDEQGHEERARLYAEIHLLNARGVPPQGDANANRR